MLIEIGVDEMHQRSTVTPHKVSMFFRKKQSFFLLIEL